MGHIADRYDSDFVAWTEEQAAALRRAGAARINADVDWDHVAEEIEDLGKSRLHAAQSLLEQIIIHLLKLEYSPATEPCAHWRREVKIFRLELAKRLRMAPSLRGKLDLEEIYADALALAAVLLECDAVVPEVLPRSSPYTMTELLDDGFWPQYKHMG